MMEVEFHSNPRENGRGCLLEIAITNLRCGHERVHRSIYVDGVVVEGSFVILSIE